MLDNLREAANASPLFQDDQVSKGQQADSSRKLILGMTAPQRFVLSLMLLMMTVLFGSFCLIVSGRIVLPF